MALHFGFILLALLSVLLCLLKDERQAIQLFSNVKLKPLPGIATSAWANQHLHAPKDAQHFKPQVRRYSNAPPPDDRVQWGSTSVWQDHMMSMALAAAFVLVCIKSLRWWSSTFTSRSPKESTPILGSWTTVSIGGDRQTTTQDTITAIATAVAAGAGSVAIVRVSGPDAVAIGQRMFRIAGKKQEWGSHRVLYGHIIHHATGDIIDEALLLFMQAPRSFTAEDVVEFHCHGGLIIVQKVLAETLACGARLANPGEFSQRAFLNGRLDLTQAEALADVIGARSQQAVQMALSGLDGGLGKTISQLRKLLLEQLAELEARIDFDEDLPPLDEASVCAAVADVRQKLEELIQGAAQSQLLRDGLRVAIVGPPNVGKSSLLNLLSKVERAIVTDIPGTTRDTVESELVIRGVPITLIDTAGIRDTDDPVERIGIERSQQALQAADVVVQVFDLQKGWGPADEMLAQSIPHGLPCLRVGNKLDLGPAPHAMEQANILMSATSGDGLTDFEAKLMQCCGAPENTGVRVNLNRRQLSLAQRAAGSLGQVLQTAEEDLPLDFWTIDLRDAIQTLGEITGEEVSEATLDLIFSKFCIGK